METKTGCQRQYGVTLPPGEPTVPFTLNNLDGDVKTRLCAGRDRDEEITRALLAERRRRLAHGSD